MALLNVRLFGGFEATSADGRRHVLSGQKERAVLAVLATARGGEQSRDHLAGLLWSDRGNTQARDSLKHAIAHIKQSLSAHDHLVISADRTTVRLVPEGLGIDSMHFEISAAAATLEGDLAALDLWCGPFLEGLSIADAAFQEWLAVERARFQAIAETIGRRHLARAVSSGDPLQTAAAASRLLQIDPHSEEGCRQLMKALAAQGEMARAVSVFLRFKDVLQRDLDVEPTRETQSLLAAIRMARRPPLLSVAVPRLSAGPSVAVLPFRNASGDPDQAHLAEGIAEDIISALAQYRWFTVLSRNSSFSLRDADATPQEISRTLGVRYLLTGSVRRSGGRIRLTGELIDGESGLTLWSSRQDQDVRDILALQDELAQQVVGALEPEMLIGESRRSRARPLAEADAYDFHMRGVWHHNQQDRAEDFAAAITWQQRAIATDPDFARAHMVLARSLYARCLFGHSTDIESDAQACAIAAERALALDSGDAYSHYATCLAHLMIGRPAQALAAAERAIAINPSLALAHNAVGWSRIFVGRAQDALDPLDTALRLSPSDPLAYLFLSRKGLARYHLGDYEAAVHHCEEALSLRQRHFILAVLLASLGQMGRLDAADKLLPALHALSPADHHRYWQMITIYSHEADRQHMFEGLRKAGLGPSS